MMTPPHIPDDELHAYLDQALPRSRCVTLESHLAACPGCQARRDATAALRDRTTLLLAQLTPERKRIPPSYEELQRRAATRPTPRRFGWRDVAWAASILLAVGAGYGMRSSGPRAPSTGATERMADGILPAAPLVNGALAAPAATPGPPEGRRAAAATRTPASPVEDARDQVALGETLPSPRSSEISTDTLPPETAPTAGLWRTVPWAEAGTQMGGQPPRVDGVPVVEVQMRPSRDQERETPVTVVAQQLASGQLITTIEGPVDDVWALLSRRGDGGETAGAETVRQGSRLLAVTGQLPADSLRAMVRRVNAARRVQ
jgi:anti-sigma factor RsiW